jgi:type II secretory pathway component PulF
MVLVGRYLGPQSDIRSFLLYIFICLAALPAWVIAAVILWRYLLPKLGSLLAKWRQHIPPFFRILPFDSSDWMFYEWWILVFVGLLLPPFVSA